MTSDSPGDSGDYNIYNDDLKGTELEGEEPNLEDENENKKVLETDEDRQMEDISDIMVANDDHTENLPDFYADTENNGDSEKVGLLLESVAKKMCNITHKVSDDNIEEEHLGHGDNNGCEEHHKYSSKSGLKSRTYKDERRGSPSAGRKLLRDRQMSAEEALEQSKDVEC